MIPDIVNVKIMPEDTGAMLTRTLVVFGVTVATTLALIWIQRKASSPDFFLTVKMRGLNVVAQTADRQANFWHNISSKATALYLESRP